MYEETFRTFLKRGGRAPREERVEQVPFALAQFRDVNADHVDRLAAVGIRNVKQVLEACRTPSDRANLVTQTGIPPDAILEFVKLSDLARIPGIKGIRARLYHDAGVDTVEKLGAWDPAELEAMLNEWVAQTGFDGIAPLPKEVAFSVATAQRLPNIIDYKTEEKSGKHMSTLERLSSAAGDSTGAANKAVAREALEHPQILDEIAVGLGYDDRKLVGDCAEVFTEVAKENPVLVAPYAEHLVPLADHKDTRVRWEATHAIALVAALVPELIAPLLPNLVAKIEGDKSVIVRDCAVIALGEYGRSGPEAAREVCPYLWAALHLWEGKHSKLVLEAMSKLLTVEPALKPEVQAAARQCLDHHRANVRRLAHKLLKE